MTGTSDDYDDGDVDGLVDRIEEAFGNYTGSDDLVTFRVRAEIEWNNTLNPQPVRSTGIPDVDISGIRAALEAMHDGPKLRPMAKSWEAQLRALDRTRAGRELLGREGFNPSARSLRRWKAGGNIGAGYRGKVERAARAQYEQRQAAHEQRRADARRAVADAVTDAIREATAGDVRFRHIEFLEFD